MSLLYYLACSLYHPWIPRFGQLICLVTCVASDGYFLGSKNGKMYLTNTLPQLSQKRWTLQQVLAIPFAGQQPIVGSDR